MFAWGITFLIVALAAAVLVLTGIAGVAGQIAWIIFVFGLVLAILFAILGIRRL
jgi:uncharacterized membrane protein YtjA (UPF0391 family)